MVSQPNNIRSTDLERRIQVSLHTQIDNLLCMRIINMCIDSKEPLEDGLHSGLEGFGKRCR